MPGQPVDEPAPDGPQGRRGDRPPAAVTTVLAAVVVEALALAVFAGAVLVELLGGATLGLGVSLFVIAFFAGLAWMLGACTRALWQGRRGGRSPVAGWQIFQGLIGIALLGGGTTWAVIAGAAALVLAGTVLIGLMTRPVVEHTTD